VDANHPSGYPWYCIGNVEVFPDATSEFTRIRRGASLCHARPPRNSSMVATARIGLVAAV